MTIGLRYLTKVIAAQPRDRRRGVIRAADTEIDVIEGVQEIRAELEIDPFGDPRLLGQVQIEACELRPVEKDGRETALPSVNLDTSTAISRRDVAASRRSPAAVAVGGGGAHIEGFDRVVNDVLRQVIGYPGRIIEAHLQGVL